MIISGAVAVAGTVALLSVPTGPCSLTLTAAGTVYIGTSALVSPSIGFPLGSAPVMVQGFEGSRGSQLFATAAGTVTTAWILSTPE